MTATLPPARVAALVVAALALALAAGCTGDTPDGTTTAATPTTSPTASATPSVNGTPELLRVEAGVAQGGFAAAQITGTLSRNEAGCLFINDVLLVMPDIATRDASDVVVNGKAYPLGGTMSGSGGYLHPAAVAQVMDEPGLAAWKACGAPQQTAVIADASTIS